MSALKSEIQQQPETQSQMASETCITMIVHPDFKSDSPLEAHFETSTFDQLASDTNISVSEDQTYCVQPLHCQQIIIIYVWTGK